MSNDSATNNYKNLTFTSLLKEYDKIVIPMIQRDYAQGRTDKKAQEVRTNLLNDIFDEKKESVHFDLIFGSCEKRNENDGEKRCFIPVDGQQRLTTLFLLYLYAQKKEQHIEEVDLSKFSYDTRRAAADFCKKVTSKEWKIVDNRKVSDIIKDSVWFMDYWVNDPTVAGMLNMLDEIHDMDMVKGKTDFPNLDKISFYFYDLDQSGLNETLYLKMNSRGKPLTAFEKLKASIEKVLPDNLESCDANNCFPENPDAPKSFKDKWRFFMDRDWIAAFWNSEKAEETDKNTTAFIVRFLSGYYNAFNEDSTVSDDLKGINSKENYADFIPFKLIETILKDDVFSKLAYAFTTIVNVANIKPSWNESTTSVNLSEYKIIAVVFTFVFFDGDKSAMRFAWNMVENTITNYDTFISYCQRVREILSCYKKNKDIYQILANNDFKNPSAQLKEEIAKAKQILNGTKRQDGKSWEEIIIEAENYAFFKGAIRFLFQDENGDVNWDNFDTKWENAKKYFDENGVKDGEEDDKKYKTNALLMKSLLANGEWENIWWYFEFSNDSAHWKRILISENWKKAVHKILSEDITRKKLEEFVKNITDNNIRIIVDDGLMDYICNHMSSAWIRSTYHDYHAIWKSNHPAEQVVLNPILSKLQNNEISYCDRNKIKNCRYYKCHKKNVDFQYKFEGKNYFFEWWGEPNEEELDVYLMKDNWSDYKSHNPTTNFGTDKDKYFCFKVEDNMTPDAFIENLNDLIRQAEEDKKAANNDGGSTDSGQSQQPQS